MDFPTGGEEAAFKQIPALSLGVSLLSKIVKTHLESAMAVPGYQAFAFVYPLRVRAEGPDPLGSDAGAMRCKYSPVRHITKKGGPGGTAP